MTRENLERNITEIESSRYAEAVKAFFDKEPSTSFWKRLQANLGRLLPIRSQL